MPHYFNSGGETSGFFSKTPISTNYTLIIGLCILFAIVAGLVYLYVIKPSLKTTYKSNSEQVQKGQGDNHEAELLFFFADWCPHCKAAKPIWNDIKVEYENKTINGYTVLFTEIDCTETTPEVEKMMDQYNIEGFPTIKLLKDGQVFEYDAKPTKEALTQFLNSVL